MSDAVEQNQFSSILKNISCIICKAGTQTQFDEEVQKLSGFDIRFMYGLVRVTTSEGQMEQRIRKIVTEGYLRRHAVSSEELTSEQRLELDKLLSGISIMTKRKQRARNLVKNSLYLHKVNLATAWKKRAYDIGPEKQFEHLLLSECGIPAIGFEWEAGGCPVWDKPWYPPESYEPDAKTKRLMLLLDREERARKRWEEMVELYGRRGAIAIISKGKKGRRRDFDMDVGSKCLSCQFKGSKVCGYCRHGGD